MEPGPSIVSWNLTRLCNEACRHCYLDAGPRADRAGELSTSECLETIAQLAELAPGALLIFTGGEPLLRRDLPDLARAARAAGLTVVVGTNGLLLTPPRLGALRDAGVQGVALSLDSLDPEAHDAFRGRRGAWAATVAGIENLKACAFPFVLQTTLSRANRGELERLVAFAAEAGARAHNLYFLVPSGRGHAFGSDLSAEEYEAVLAEIRRLQEGLADGRLLLGVKCAPHYQRLLWQESPGSPYRRGFADGGACPAGTHYLGIRPNGDVTPCPYLPVYGGNLRDRPLAEIWSGSEVFRRLRERGALGGRCGACEFRLLCGGCRARAFGSSGDLMGEDPCCGYRPGTAGGETIAPEERSGYGLPGRRGLPWDADALALMEKIPAFVRGRVVRRVEERARELGESRVTVDLMREARRRAIPEMSGFWRKDPSRPFGGGPAEKTHYLYRL